MKKNDVSADARSWLLCKLNEPSSKPSNKKPKEIGIKKTTSQPWNLQAMNDATANIEAENNKPKYGMFDQSTKSSITTAVANIADFISLLIF